MPGLYDSKILKLSNFYKRNILSKIGGIRGMTRPNIMLRDFGIKQITQKEKDNYIINLTDSKSRKFTNLELVKKYVSIEYNQSCRMIDEIEEDTVFYDVGGFEGFHTLLGTLGEKVYTFEPDPNNLEKLKENIELNPDQEIEIIEKPVWNKVEKLSLEIGKGGESSVGDGDIEKESTALDNFVIEEGNTPPDVIKIDVEGAEQKVLEGGKEVLERYAPVLFIEVHVGSALSKMNGSEEEIDLFLKNLGYRVNEDIKRGNQKHKIYSQK